MNTPSFINHYILHVTVAERLELSTEKVIMRVQSLLWDLLLGLSPPSLPPGSEFPVGIIYGHNRRGS